MKNPKKENKLTNIYIKGKQKHRKEEKLFSWHLTAKSESMYFAYGYRNNFGGASQRNVFYGIDMRHFLFLFNNAIETK